MTQSHKLSDITAKKTVMICHAAHFGSSFLCGHWGKIWQAPGVTPSLGSAKILISDLTEGEEQSRKLEGKRGKKIVKS